MSICKFINKPIQIISCHHDKALTIKEKHTDGRKVTDTTDLHDRQVSFLPYHGNINQQWTVKYHGNNTISIRSYTDQNVVLDVKASKTENARFVISYQQNNPITENQLWKIVETRDCDGFILEPLHAPGKVLTGQTLTLTTSSYCMACIYTKKACYTGHRYNGGRCQVMRFKIENLK
jgi:hypothetical protein